MNRIARLAADPGKVRLLRTLALAILALAAAGDLVLVASHRVHGHLSIENLPLSGLVLGGLAALLVAVTAKGPLQFLVSRPGEYYRD